MSDTETTRRGKIARLPQSLREELCLRMLNGEPGSKLLPWLNAQPATAAVVSEQFGGEAVTDSNLTNWRQGGFEDWRKKRERVESTKELARFAGQLAHAGGGTISEGAAAIAAGKVLQVLELVSGADLAAGSADDEAGDLFTVKSLTDLTNAVGSLRHGDQQNKKLALIEEKLKQTGKTLEIAEAKFQRETAALFEKFYESKQAKEIMASGKDSKLKREELIQLMFGARPGGPKQYPDEKEGA
jgi:hypothetical protein